MQKPCTGCGDIKPLTEFHRRTKSPDGLQPRCKQCVREYKARHYLPGSAAFAKRSAQARAKTNEYRQDPEYRERERAYAKRRYRTRTPEQIEKALAHTRKWSANNSEYKRSASSMYRARRRRVKTYVSVSYYIRSLIGKPCFYCEEPSDSHDHVIPLSRGGDHSEGNIVPCCGACNSSKGSKLVVEWLYGK